MYSRTVDFKVFPQRFEVIIQAMGMRAWGVRMMGDRFGYGGDLDAGGFSDCLRYALESLYPGADVQYRPDFELLVRAYLQRYGRISRKDVPSEICFGWDNLRFLNGIYLERFKRFYDENREDAVHYGWIEYKGSEFKRWALEIAFDEKDFDFSLVTLGSVRKRDLAVI